MNLFRYPGLLLVAFAFVAHLAGTNPTIAAYIGDDPDAVQVEPPASTPLFASTQDPDPANRPYCS